ncbi:MAG: hypothetical protein AABZ53_09695 [Planctomycetota bacterium]
MTTRTQTTFVRVFATASLGLFAGLACAQPEYDFVHFDYPGAGEVVLSDINDHGVACGRIGMNSGLELGFVWSQATGITIVPVYKPQGLNNSRLVVGLGDVYSVGIGQLWEPSGLPGTYGPPTFGDADDTGVVVGAISTSSGSDSNGVSYIPYIWDAVNGARTLPIPNARGLVKINNTGGAIGWLYNSSTNDGFYADVNTGAYTVLASIFPSNLGIGPVRASGINDLGQIVGSRASAAYPIQRYGYIYSPGTGFQMLPFPGVGYHQAVTPVSINNAGTVVGTLSTEFATQHVFVYSAANGLRDLWNNHTIIAGMPTGYRLHYAAKINNQGWIAGWGYTASFHQTSFVLKPRVVACPADFDADGTVDFFDYDAFVNCFEGLFCPQGKTADFDADGTVDFFDYDAFVIAFEAGC